MQITNQVIHLAKECALSKFSVLAHNMVADADNSIKQAMLSLGAGDKSLSAARQLLREDGKLLIERLQTLFRDYLERAMQTMYTDLRTGLHNVSADHLSLIDDETVNRQIEVERLVVRLRDAGGENLGHLNLMIAQLHEDHDVRERENPFRPYLLARSLHEVLRGMVGDHSLAKVLFDHLSGAMTMNLAEYYVAIRQVFESSGVRSKLLARPSAPGRPPRDMAAQQASHAGPVATALGVATGSQVNIAASHSGQANQPAALQDFIWQILNQGMSAGPAYQHGSQHASSENGAIAAQVRMQGALASAPPSVSPALVSQLKQYQQLVARGQAVSEQLSPDHNQLFSVKEQIGPHKASERERVTIEVVARLFEFILQDEQIPTDWRAQIGRLQIPLLKAALLRPELLQQASHPARQLLNRMGSVAVAAGFAPDAAIDQMLESEVIVIVSKILENFDDDVTIFSDCLKGLNQFMVQHLRHVDAATAQCIEAVEEAEKIRLVLTNISKALRALLAPLNVDPQVSDFIMRTWVRVMLLPLCDGRRADASNAGRDADYREVLADLIWSTQEKQTPQERNVLIRLLPDLVKRLKTGLEMIRLPEPDAKRAMDELVAVHARVLRSSQTGTANGLPSLEELHQHFSALVIDRASLLQPPSEPLKIPPAVLEAALAKRRISSKLETRVDANATLGSDAGQLAKMQLGTCVEFGPANNGQTARLAWVSTHQSLYIFKTNRDSVPIIYSSISMSQALRDGVVRPIESAALFERAVQSIRAGAESV